MIGKLQIKQNIPKKKSNNSIIIFTCVCFEEKQPNKQVVSIIIQ